MQGVNATQTNVSIAPFRAECSSMLEGRGGERRGREGKARQGKARQGRQGKGRQGKGLGLGKRNWNFSPCDITMSSRHFSIEFSYLLFQ